MICIWCHRKDIAYTACSCGGNDAICICGRIMNRHYEGCSFVWAPYCVGSAPY